MAVEIVPIEISVKAKADVKPIHKIKEKANEAASATNKISKNMKKISTESKHSQNAFSKLGSSIKRILLYRAIRTALRQITQAFSEGVKNLYQYSKAMNGSFANAMDRAATSLLYFKNALGTLAAPLIEMAVPILEKGIDVIVDIINKINEAIAALRGQATYTRAIKYWIKYAEAAEKAKSATIGIDELNVIGDNNGNQLDYTKMFEEAKVGADNMSEAVKPFYETFEHVKGIIAWINDVWNRNGSKIVGTVENLFNNFVMPTILFIAEAIDKITKNEGLNKIIDAVFSLINKISQSTSWKKTLDFISKWLDKLLGLFDKLSPSILKIIELADKLAPLFDAINSLKVEVLSEVFDLAAEKLTPVLKLLNFVLSTIVGLVGVVADGFSTGDWAGAWNTFKTQFEKDWNELRGKDPLVPTPNSIEDVLAEYGAKIRKKDPNNGDGSYNPTPLLAPIVSAPTPNVFQAPIDEFLSRYIDPETGASKTEVTTTINVDSRAIAIAVAKGNVKKGATFVRGYVM